MYKMHIYTEENVKKKKVPNNTDLTQTVGTQTWKVLIN